MSGSVIAVYGGSFDPPHWGHVDNVTFLSRHRAIDQVMVVPAMPSKEKTQSAPYLHRLQMCMAAFGSIPRVAISEIERELGRSRTLDTLRSLKRAWPGVTFRPVFGADIAPDVPEWDGGAELLEEFSPIVLSRYGFPGGTQTGASLCSSNEVRARARIGDWPCVRSMVPARVYDHIVKNGLYSTGPLMQSELKSDCSWRSPEPVPDGQSPRGLESRWQP